MNQLGSLNGTSNLNALTDLKAKSSKPLNARSPEKPSSSFADLIQKQEPKVTPKKAVEDTKSPERTEKAEKPERNTEKKEASKEAQIDQKNDPGKADKGEKKTQKDRAMLEFMDSMESELGIPPEEIVAAMALLKPSDLQKSPEETANQVIENLDLPKEEQGKALALYMAFLQQSKTPDLKPDQMFIQKNLGDVAPKLPGMETLTAEQRKNQMSQGLDKMNNSFFLQDAAGSQRMMEARQAEADKLQALRDQSGQDLSMLDSKDGKFELPAGMKPIRPEDLEIPQPKKPFLTELEMEALSEKSPAELEAMKAQLEKSNAKSDKKTTPDDFFALAALKAQMQENGKAPVKTATDAKDQQALPQFEVPTANVKAGGASADSQGDSQNMSDMFAKSQAGGDETKLKTGKPTAGKVTVDEFFPHLGLGAASKSDGAQSLNAVVAKNDVNLQANVDKIAEQAKIITFKGGGEATVKLNEEGLGEVSLKVHVKDGKVNLEMATETKEAKKLLESSLSDLRTSLAGHKLSIDQVKVDVGNQTSTDSQNQKQPSMDARPDLNQGKQFMSQFRDEMSGRRDQFVEMPGIRSYQTKRQTPDPIGAAPEVGAASRKSLSPGRGQNMNLVA